jgi:hypothetical protein
MKVSERARELAADHDRSRPSLEEIGRQQLEEKRRLEEEKRLEQEKRQAFERRDKGFELE